MSFYIVTGRLGSGKTLVSVSRIKTALSANLRVATNLDIYPENIFPLSTKNFPLVRIPDFPEVSDFDALGYGSEVVADESKFGLIVLDECSAFFNARSWADKGRQNVIDWLKHSRKLRWHVYLIVQSESMLDKQIRDSFGEHLVICKRMDRLAIPFFGAFFKLFGLNIRPPKIHIGIVRYGLSKSDPIVDRWLYRGHDLYKGYNTEQLFDPDRSPAIHSVLSPYHLKGRLMDKFKLAKYMASGIIGSAFITGLLVSALSFFVYNHYFSKLMSKQNSSQTLIKSDVKVSSYIYLDGKMTVYLTDGIVITPQSFKKTSSGIEVLYNGQWIGSAK